MSFLLNLPSHNNFDDVLGTRRNNTNIKQDLPKPRVDKNVFKRKVEILIK
jgi:hypothetical protein